MHGIDRVVAKIIHELVNENNRLRNGEFSAPLIAYETILKDLSALLGVSDKSSSEQSSSFDQVVKKLNILLETPPSFARSIRFLEDRLAESKTKAPSSDNVPPKVYMQNAAEWVNELLRLLTTEKCKPVPIDASLDLYKKALRCSVCDHRRKDCVLIGCGHLFCKVCLEANLKVRNKKCPICGELYSSNDIKTIFF